MEANQIYMETLKKMVAVVTKKIATIFSTTKKINLLNRIV